MSKRPHYSIAAALVILTLGVGFGIGRGTAPVSAPNVVLRESGYKYINPVLLCNVNIGSQTEDTALSKKIRQYVQAAPEQTVGVYYLNLADRTWAGFNQDEHFSPASMLKVPAMAAILRYADEHPGILQKEIYYDGSFDDNRAEYYKPQKAITPGQSYTVDELLSYMIEYSDNNAAKLLDTEVIPANDLSNIYVELDIQLPADLGDIMSPQTYSTFLRLLYNSTYLTRQSSEKALELMAAPDFPTGLQAGIPASVTVAQKFGERLFVDPGGTTIGRELHDCGIVYGKNPYALCVMTRGGSPSTAFEQLAKEIRDISKLVYNYQNSQ